ncbi:MAG: RecB-family nuclease [Desulfurococcus sp.]|nr:RecB-family nuclease [Desulfurococcus sp.]
MALYLPSSIQKLMDFIKAVYTSSILVPVVVKPIGAAAQIGVPEAHKLAIKLGRPFIVLPEVRDLRGVLGCERVVYVSEAGREVGVEELIAGSVRTALLLGSGDQEPSGREIEGLEIAWPRGVPKGMPVTALAGILVYEILRIKG